MLSCWVPSKRPAGAPEFTYGRGLFKSMKKAGADLNGWYNLAYERYVWRDIICGL